MQQLAIMSNARRTPNEITTAHSASSSGAAIETSGTDVSKGVALPTATLPPTLATGVDRGGVKSNTVPPRLVAPW